MLYYQMWAAGMSLFIRSLQLEVIGTRPKDTATSDGNFGTVTDPSITSGLFRGRGRRCLGNHLRLPL